MPRSLTGAVYWRISLPTRLHTCWSRRYSCTPKRDTALWIGSLYDDGISEERKYAQVLERAPWNRKLVGYVCLQTEQGLLSTGAFFIWIVYAIGAQFIQNAEHSPSVQKKKPKLFSTANSARNTMSAHCRICMYHWHSRICPLCRRF